MMRKFAGLPRWCSASVPGSNRAVFAESILSAAIQYAMPIPLAVKTVTSSSASTKRWKKARTCAEELMRGSHGTERCTRANAYERALRPGESPKRAPSPRARRAARPSGHHGHPTSGPPVVGSTGTVAVASGDGGVVVVVVVAAGPPSAPLWRAGIRRLLGEGRQALPVLADDHDDVGATGLAHASDGDLVGPQVGARPSAP